MVRVGLPASLCGLRWTAVVCRRLPWSSVGSVGLPASPRGLRWTAGITCGLRWTAINGLRIEIKRADIAGIIVRGPIVFAPYTKVSKKH